MQHTKGLPPMEKHVSDSAFLKPDKQVGFDALLLKLSANSSDIRQIDLSNLNLNTNQLISVCDHLSMCTHIIKVIFCGNIINSQVARRISILLLENVYIDVLDLSFCFLNDHVMKIIIVGLENRNKLLKNIFLAGNMLSSQMEEEALGWTKIIRGHSEGTGPSLDTMRTSDEARKVIEYLVRENAILKANYACLREEHQKCNEKEKNYNMIRAKKQQYLINLQKFQITNSSENKNSSIKCVSCHFDGWQCAMKEMNLNDALKGEIKSMNNEIEFLEKLPFHPNIVRYLFHQHNPNSISLFTSIYSTTLHDVIIGRRLVVSNENGAYFHPKDIAKWAAQIATGIDFLQKHKIVHRNLKTDNILCMIDGGYITTLVISGLYSARQIKRKGFSKSKVGTVPFMAPEVITGGNMIPYSYKADVWALGMILYEMTTLMEPYEEQDKKQISPIYDPLIEIFKGCVLLDPEQRMEIRRARNALLHAAYDYDIQVYNAE